MASHSTWMPASTSTELAEKLGIDAITAATTALIISPVVTTIDSAIMTKAATGRSFSSCCSKILRPLSSIPYNLLLARPARLVYAVYCGTYLTANCCDTILSSHKADPSTATLASTVKFGSIALVSTGLTVYKDSRLSQIFATQSRNAAVPLISYSLFTLRDAITIYASFELPARLAPKLTGMIEQETQRLKVAQFLLPAAIQFITTPIHLLGFDLHNRRGVLGMKSRLDRVGRDLGTAIPARIVRIVPAFGVGGVFNLSMRSWMRDRLDRRQN